jgi:hypothetical protein
MTRRRSMVLVIAAQVGFPGQDALFGFLPTWA